MHQIINQQGSAVLHLVEFLVVLAIVIIAAIHFLTTSRDFDRTSTRPSGGYLKFLQHRKPELGAIKDIPAPPDGRRDEEVEKLIMAGRIGKARELLESRMEDARVAPIGRDARIKNVAHYMGLLDSGNPGNPHKSS